MLRSKWLIALGGFFLLLTSPSLAQRSEDHFFRRRVVLRMDLNEKINRPLLGISGTYEAGSPGLVQTLIEGLADGDYLAYHPDDLRRAVSHAEYLDRLRDFEDEEPTALLPEEEEEDGSPDSMDRFGFAVDSAAGTGSMGLGASVPVHTPAYANCEQVIQVVEDWIFDKNSGQMIYRPRFIEVIWSDPNGTLPEKKVAVFRYEDVQPRLEATAWVNRFNDAEARNLREIFALKLYHAYVIEVSGRGIRSLREAQSREQALIAWEQYVWSL